MGRKLGYKHTKETLEKLKGINKGPKNGNWTGGWVGPHSCTKCNKPITRASKSGLCKSCCRVGVKFGIDHRRKIGLGKLGEKNPAKQDWVRKKISKTVSSLWKTESYRVPQLKALMKISNHAKNASEARLEDVLSKILPKEYKYTGDGKAFICGKVPDFLHSRKKIIEFFGDFWHANPKKYRSSDIIYRGKTAKDIWNEDKNRIRKFKQKGFSVLVIWESDFNENRNKIIKDILKFTTSDTFNYDFFCNFDCKFFPCHKGIPVNQYSCLLCYCPLFSHRDTNAVCQVCGPCEKCTFPHVPANYDKLVKILTEYYALEQDRTRKAKVIPKLKKLKMKRWDRKKKKWVSGFWTND